jgi:hypothetical protein
MGDDRRPAVPEFDGGRSRYTAGGCIGVIRQAGFSPTSHRGIRYASGMGRRSTPPTTTQGASVDRSTDGTVRESHQAADGDEQGQAEGIVATPARLGPPTEPSFWKLPLDERMREVDASVPPARSRSEFVAT